jgi:CheY-like chemotaxis protein
LVLFVHVETTRELEESLGEKGYRILAPYPREETIRGAKLLKPDVIAIAFHLPEADGLDVLAHLKAEPGVRDIPVVMLADETEPQLEQRALELGADAVHTGPLEAEGLQQVFRAVLEEGRARS